MEHRNQLPNTDRDFVTDSAMHFELPTDVVLDGVDLIPTAQTIAGAAEI